MSTESIGSPFHMRSGLSTVAGKDLLSHVAGRWVVEKELADGRTRYFAHYYTQRGAERHTFTDPEAGIVKAPVFEPGVIFRRRPRS